jgi:N-methylhydantoinase A
MDFVQTISAKLANPNWAQIREWFADKEKQAAEQLEQEMGLIEMVTAVRSGDARFEGQGFNTEVPLSDAVLKSGDTAAFAAAFYARYEQLYGVMQSNIPGELINIRLTVIGKRKPNPLMTAATGAKPPSRVTRRGVYFDGKRQSIPVFRRSDLAAGAALTGPCIVDQEDTTTFIRSHWRAEVDAYGILHLARQ